MKLYVHEFGFRILYLMALFSSLFSQKFLSTNFFAIALIKRSTYIIKLLTYSRPEKKPRAKKIPISKFIVCSRKLRRTRYI